MSNQNPPERIDRLLANVSHLHHGRHQQLLERLGLYRGQPPVLFALWNQEGLAQSELVERMRVTPATMTKMLQRMEQAGFIQRRPDPNDQRVMRVYLTEAGRAVKTDLEAVREQIEGETFAGFGPDELAALRGMLERLRENLLAATGEEPWK